MSKRGEREDLMRIIPTPPALIGAVWPVLKPLVLRVLAECRGRRDLPTTAHEMLTGQVATWTVFDEDADTTVGFFTARVCEYDGFKLLGVELVAGDNLDAWEKDALDELVSFAKAHGCRGLEGYGRGAAWARRQKRYGWKPVFTTIELLFEEETPDGQVSAEATD